MDCRVLAWRLLLPWNFLLTCYERWRVRDHVNLCGRTLMDEVGTVSQFFERHELQSYLHTHRTTASASPTLLPPHYRAAVCAHRQAKQEKQRKHMLASICSIRNPCSAVGAPVAGRPAEKRGYHWYLSDTQNENKEKQMPSATNTPLTSLTHSADQRCGKAAAWTRHRQCRGSLECPGMYAPPRGLDGCSSRWVWRSFAGWRST